MIMNQNNFNSVPITKEPQCLQSINEPVDYTSFTWKITQYFNNLLLFLKKMVEVLLFMQPIQSREFKIG